METVNKVIDQFHVNRSVVQGVAIGALLSPLFAPIVMFFVPILSLLGVIAAPLIGYGMLGPMQLRPRDFIWTLKAIYAKGTVTIAAKRNVLVDEFWYSAYNKVGPHRPMMYFIDEKLTYTYGDCEKDSNRFARFGLQRGLKPGDTVALVLQNKPQFVAAWIGLAKIGVRSALVNFNLKGDPLSHSLKEAKAKAVIFDADLAGRIDDVRDELSSELSDALFAYSPNAKATVPDWAKNLDSILGSVSPDAIDKKDRAQQKGVKVSDPVLYIYTSGTTGLPKASKITHFRYLLASYGFAVLCGFKESDRTYTALPLYHSAGGMIGVGTMLYNGSFMVLRKKFSARSLGKDVREHSCTVLQYIGEMCRYAVATEANDADRQSGLRMAVGNGLRSEVWQTFQEKYGIGKICEFYAATEGAGALINTDGRVGSVGFMSPLADPAMKVRIVKYDEEKDELVRDAQGRCVLCAPDEPGELLFEIQDRGGVRNFDGYQSAEATAKKVARDVLAPGDSFFRSGDLLKRDKEHFFFFVDRLGDTFRWKGENCSTGEIASVIEKNSDVKGDFAVYGVSVPKCDGKAGAVAIEGDADSFDFHSFLSNMKKHLPAYAVPLFLRFRKELEKTSTHKIKKAALQKEGCDPANIGSDKMYVFDQSKDDYVELTRDVYSKISSGSFRL